MTDKRSLLQDERDQTVEVVDTSVPWVGRVMDIKEDHLILPSMDEPIVRQYIDHPGAVAVVALRGEDDETQVLLEKQYRHPVGRRLWELPAGLLDIVGEDYLLAAQRELREETDYEASQWDVLVDLFTTPGGSNESVRIYLARNLSQCEEKFARFDEEADMELRWVLLDEAVKLVLAGRIHNSLAVSGILATQIAKTNNWQDLRPINAPWGR